MKKTENIVVTILSLLLIAGIVMGVFALFKRIEETLSDIEETESTTETVAPGIDDNGSESETDSVTVDPNLYINEATGTGYHTVNGKTYFFKIFEYSSSLGNDLSFNDASFKSFSNYTPSFYYCRPSNGSIAWKTQTLAENAEGGANNLTLTSSDNQIYMVYTVISNCTNPAYILSDLNQNVFFDTAYFNVYRTSISG